MMKEPDLIMNMKETNVALKEETTPTTMKSKKMAVESSSTVGSSTTAAASSMEAQTSPKSKKKSSSNLNNNNKSALQSLESVKAESTSPSPPSPPLPLMPQTPPSAATTTTNTTTTTSSTSFIDFNLTNDRISVLKCNNQIKELHTLLRDKETSHSDFKFYSDRLIRLLVEASLNQLPYSKQIVITPANCEYNGIKYFKGVCGVSIMRSGEAMEKGLRECCRSIRIGKILVQSVEDDHGRKKSSVIYAKFPSDIVTRKILLMYPIMTSGSTVNLAINVLKEHNVAESNILVLCLFSTPAGIQSVNSQYPDVHILTSEIHPSVPTDFGQRYFGTE